MPLSCPSFNPAHPDSDSKKFRIGGQVFESVFCDDGEVFDAYGASTGIIEARFNGDDVSGAEVPRGFANARGFVDFKAQAVAGAVEESLHAAVYVAGFKVAVFK